jgi:multiple sugar transport system substrate-binding protein
MLSIIKELPKLSLPRRSEIIVKRMILLFVVIACLLIPTQPLHVKAAKKTLTWFVGFGKNTNSNQPELVKKLVAKFNAAHPDLELKIQVSSYYYGSAELNALISAGNAPDIVGPSSLASVNSFADEWLDLTGLIQKNDYDLTRFPSNVVNIYAERNGLYAIPFAVSPSLIYYNKDLFDRAGLAYPPKKFGEKYILDGKQLDWSWDTVATLAKRLTVDAKGNVLTSSKFDPTQIKQYGFDQQESVRSNFETFGGAPMINPDTGKVQLAEAWRAEARWMWNGIWKEHFIPNDTFLRSQVGPNYRNAGALLSGRIAMMRNSLGYAMCCLDDEEVKLHWDLAPVPMYQGNYYAPANADSFFIDKHTKNPEAAFTALTYLLGEAAPELLEIYQGFPARLDLQDAAIKAIAAKYPKGKNWDVVKPSLNYIPIPHHESAYPKFEQGQRRLSIFQHLLRDNQGKTIDIDQELDKLESYLANPPEILTWGIGLGTGTTQNQLDVENKVVERFNATHTDIELRIITPLSEVEGVSLSSLIARNIAPDIIGPASLQSTQRYPNEWLDLTGLVKKHNYNLTQFPKNVVNIFAEGNGLYALPFAAHPGLMYYNKDLFDEAGLAYLPKKYGEKYILDGKPVDWSWDTVAKIAKILTVDANGNKATSPKYDPSQVVQFGFTQQWDSIRSDFGTFGGAPLINPATGKVQIVEAWRAEAHWLWNGIWKDHFIPNAAYLNTDLLGNNAFASGHVAMVRSMSWYTCCLGELKAYWDLAPVPMYNGQYYAPADADSFFIDKHTKNPDAAFTVLAYLVGEAAPDLLEVYGAFPARPDLQAAAITVMAEKYPLVLNWEILPPSLEHVPFPHYESGYPNYQKGQNRFNDFQNLLYGVNGPHIDLDKELDKLQTDLQAIVDGVPTAH